MIGFNFLLFILLLSLLRNSLSTTLVFVDIDQGFETLFWALEPTKLERNLCMGQDIGSA